MILRFYLSASLLARCPSILFQTSGPTGISACSNACCHAFSKSENSSLFISFIVHSFSRKQHFLQKRLCSRVLRLGSTLTNVEHFGNLMVFISLQDVSVEDHP